MNTPTHGEITAWLKSIGMGAHAGAFEKHRITFAILPDLTDEDLRICGVSALGDRKKLLQEIARLPLRTIPRETPPFAPPARAPEAPPAMTAPAAIPAAPPAGSPAPAAEAARKPRILARILASKFLFISVVVHIVFGVGAAYFIVQRYSAQRKLTFHGGPPSANPAKRALEHKVSMARRPKTGGAPLQARRIATSGLSKIALPEMPSIATATNVAPGMMSGLGGMGNGQGMGVGSGMGGGMGGGGGGGGITMFGLRGGGGGLVGTFYDFKRDASGKPNGLKGYDRKTYTAIVKDFVTGGEWKPPTKFKHYTSKERLSAKAFFFPAIADTEAGEAFQAKDTGPGLWIAHYTGTITPSVSGSYRLVGWGDNVLIVGLNNRIILDASDIGYTGDKRTHAGAVSFPRKGGTPMFEGDTFQLTAGQSMRLDILLGDEGGIYCAGVHLLKQGEHYTKGKGGIPDLPLLLVGGLTEPEKKLYRAYLGDTAFKGPILPAKAAGPTSLLDVLKR